MFTRIGVSFLHNATSSRPVIRMGQLRKYNKGITAKEEQIERNLPKHSGGVLVKASPWFGWFLVVWTVWVTSRGEGSSINLTLKVGQVQIGKKRKQKLRR